MPYKTEWVDAELFFEHNGVKVYHTYRNDDMEQGVNTYWFGLSPDASFDAGDETFDVRDFPVPAREVMMGKPAPFISLLDPDWRDASPERQLEIQATWNMWHATSHSEAIKNVLREAIDAGLLVGLPDAD